MMRTMLVDDHAAFREPVAFMIDQEPDMTVVAQAGSLAEGREVLSRVGGSVDLAIIDLDLPDGNGIDLIDDLHAANRDALALVLTAYSELERTAEAVAAGAAGVLHKSARVGEVIEAARRLGAGEQLLSATEIAQLSRLAFRQRREDDRARAMIGRLTPRELDVLQALAEGLSDKEIAKRLYIGTGTVRFHMVNILTKLEAASRLQALVFAVRHDLVKIQDFFYPALPRPHGPVPEVGAQEPLMGRHRSFLAFLLIDGYTTLRLLVTDDARLARSSEDTKGSEICIINTDETDLAKLTANPPGGPFPA